MTPVVSYNFHWAFSPESRTRLAPETDPICTCLSFDLCVVPNSNIYFYIFLYEEKKEYNEAVNFKASLEVDLINV